MEMARERQRLSQVKLLSPMSGLVAIRQNRQGMFIPGMQIPDIREGDQVQPGMPVADVLDLSELEIVAKIGELDRANLKEGQDVNIRLDAARRQDVPRQDQEHERHGFGQHLLRRPGEEVRCGVLARHEGAAHRAWREAGADQKSAGRRPRPTGRKPPVTGWRHDDGGGAPRA